MGRDCATSWVDALQSAAAWKPPICIHWLPMKATKLFYTSICRWHEQSVAPCTFFVQLVLAPFDAALQLADRVFFQVNTTFFDQGEEAITLAFDPSAISALPM